MRRITTLPLLTLTACVMASAAFTSFGSDAAPTGSNWSQWRGPEGNGVSSEANLPAEWSDTKNIKWKTPIPGRGHSSPIVWGNKIFLTTDIEGEIVPGAKAVEHKDDGKPYKHPDSVGADRRHTFKVLCVDRATGKQLWERTAYEGTVYDDRHRKGSYASPTPATDGRHVYSYFGTDGLYCYDFDGNLTWKVSPG
jgi:outer membrane protein assembly factor BamB